MAITAPAGTISGFERAAHLRSRASWTRPPEPMAKGEMQPSRPGIAGLPGGTASWLPEPEMGSGGRPTGDFYAWLGGAPQLLIATPNRYPER